MNKKCSIDLLKDVIAQVEQAVKQLEIAYNHCRNFRSQRHFSEQESMDLEAMTARFSRLVDLFTSKLLRAIDAAELITDGTLIDVMNRAEKRGIIKSSESLRSLKELRNEIAHEYLLQKLELLHDNIFESIPLILDMVDKGCRYAEKTLDKLS